jgi:UDP-N-acetylglucosamine 2-epimerase (non-hydrolysing)
MKILSIIGTRPEAIKMAPIIQLLDQQDDSVSNQVCVTAQHREMLDQVLSLFNITPDFDLNIMQKGQSPSQVAASIFLGLDPILTEQKPDWVLVQGDTTTVMAAAIVAFYHRIKIGHVEAGLRSYDKWQPFPEEINRKVAGVVADLHFAPTKLSRSNLLMEGIPEKQILVTGNPVIDALKWVARLPLNQDTSPIASDILQKKTPISKRIILVTAHRRENHGKPIEQICQALLDIAKKYQDSVHIIYPVHLNPNIQEPVYRLLGNIQNITLTAPLDYLDLVHIMKAAYLVITDSGGIQEEAPGLGKPVLVLRDVTERPEAIQYGTVRLVGADNGKIVRETTRLLQDENEYHKMARATNPYGDGFASQRIVDALMGRVFEPFDI